MNDIGVNLILNKLDSIEKDVKELKEDVSVLKEDVSTLNKDTALLKKDVILLKKKVIKLEKTDNLILDEVGRVHSIMNGKLKEIEKKIS